MICGDDLGEGGGREGGRRRRGRWEGGRGQERKGGLACTWRGTGGGGRVAEGEGFSGVLEVDTSRSRDS